MQAACAEASPAEAPASNSGCPRHASMPRKRQLLPETIHASGTRCGSPPATPANNSCQQQWMPTACAEATRAAAPASITGCKWHASMLRKRRLLQATSLGATGMRRCPENGGTCPQQCVQAAPASNNACKRQVLRPRRRKLLPVTVDAPGTRRSHASMPRKRRPLPATMHEDSTWLSSSLQLPYPQRSWA